MKKVLFTMVCICLGISQIFAQNMRVVSNGTQQLTLKIDAKTLQVSDFTNEAGTFSKVSMDGYLSSTEVGMPQLPVYTQMIEIPLCGDIHATATAGSVRTYNATDLGITNPIFPAQPAYHKSYIGDHSFVKNEAVYNTNAFCGNELARVEKNGILRCNNLATVYISPVQYNPVTNEIRIYDDITVEVTYDNVDMDATRRMKRIHGNSQFTAPAEVINPMQIERDALTNAPIKYLIIANDMFNGQLDDFANWKRRKGFIVDIAYTGTIGTTTTAIKNYLQGLYDNATAENPAPTYVLLVGDRAQIPAYTGQADNGHITDLYYFTWTGNDNIPDCYYGRFSAQNVSQLTPQIDKTLMYEQYTMTDPSYLDKAVLAAGEDGGRTGDYGYSHADPAMHYLEDNYVNSNYGYTEVHAYYNPHTTSTASQMRNYLNAGVGYANYSAHCSSSGWATPAFTTSYISQMNNAGKYGVMIGNCCQSNKFDESECFGEALLRTANKGAVGYIGGTNYTYWDEDYYWAVGVRSLQTSCSNCNSATYNASNLGAYDRLFHTHGEAYSNWNVTLGAMVMAGNSAVQASSSSLKQYYWEIYSIMGDPSLMTWLTQPGDMQISIDGEATQNNAYTAMDGATSFTIATGAPYAYIALTQNLNFISAVMADANGNATLTFPALNAGDTYELAASAQNYKTQFTTITVEASNTPRVTLQSYTPESIVRGETTNVTLTMVNMGGVATTGNTNVNIACTDPMLTINDGTATYGAMAAQGGTAVVNNGFQVTANNSVESGHEFTVNYTATNNGDSWTGTFTLAVITPEIALQDHTPQNVVHGEATNLTLTMVNNGEAATTGNTNVTISCNDPMLTINRASATYGAMAAQGGTAVVNDGFQVTADDAVETGYEFTVDYTATYNGNSWTGSFILTALGSDCDAPEGLVASINGDEVTLTWPDESYQQTITITDDAESHTAWTINSPGTVGWSYIDGDGGNSGQFQNFNYTGEGSQMAYIVFNRSQLTSGSTNVTAHSGSSFFASPYTYNQANNDWMISPELNFTQPFTFSFYARSFSSSYSTEQFYVAYSTTGNEEADFTNLNSLTTTTTTWTAYSYTVPANAKYVAIHCVSNDQYMFCVDDITITGEASVGNPYNVYRDGVLIASDVWGGTYTDAGLENGTYCYTISTICNVDTETPQSEPSCVTINGTIPTYTIMAVPDDASHGTVTGGGTYQAGDQATLTATPAAHYTFSRWSDNVTTNPRTITVTGSATYTAYFDAEQYTITAIPDDASHGTVTGGGTYAYGTTITLTATPAPGYGFTSWSDNVTTNPRTITVTGNATYTANFELGSYTITAVPDDTTHGTVTGGGSYNYNDIVTLTATPATGYVFDHWNDNVTTNPRIITVTADATYTAYFAEEGEADLEDISHSVSIISGNNDAFINPGETIRVTMTSRNEGDAPALNVVSTLSSDSPFATIASPTQFFATVNASATVLSQFEVNIDANTPDNTTITFTHDIAETDNPQDADTYTFTITVVNGGSAEVSLTDVSRFVNIISGNGDNDVNPGETIKISIYSVNEGQTDANNVLSSLTSTSSYTSISSPIVTFPLMAPGINQLSQFDVVINANTPNGTEIPFTHQLTDGTHNFSENFTVLVVSTVGINENGQSLITIFPNPTTDFININLNNTIATQAVIYDVYGKKINEEALTETDNRINVSELANGVYFIKIFNEGQIVSTTKFIKK